MFHFGGPDFRVIKLPTNGATNHFSTATIFDGALLIFLQESSQFQLHAIVDSVSVENASG